MNEHGLREEVRAYLRAHNTLTLATVGPEGPWATGLFYASEDLTLYFVSDPKTRHGQNLSLNPVAAATIQEDYHDWPAIKGIQMEGTCERVGNPLHLAKIGAIYVHKFPFAARFLSPTSALHQSLSQKVGGVKFYRLTPRRLYLVDNSKGFGHRDELPLS